MKDNAKSIAKKSGLFFLSFTGISLSLLLIYVFNFMPRVGFYASAPGYVFFLASMYCLGVSVVYSVVFAGIAFGVKNKVTLGNTSVVLIAAWNSFFLIVYAALNLRHRDFFLITLLLLGMHLLSWPLGYGLSKFKKYL